MDQSCSGNSAGDRTVFVIDDDEAVRDSMRALLESYGIAMHDFASARAFLNQATDFHKGCLLLDLHMPNMSGMDLLEGIRACGGTIPIILLTGRGDSQLAARATRSGATMLHKPVGDAELMQAIERAFSAPSYT